MAPPQRQPLSRKKSFIRRWLQVRRIKKRAREGLPNRVFTKEFKPLVEEWMDEESISRNAIFEKPVREMALRGIVDVDRAIQSKVHQWALSRALTMAGIFSRNERRIVRIKMDFIRTANKREQINALKGLETAIGPIRFRKFLAWYDKTIDFIGKRIILLHESLK